MSGHRLVWALGAAQLLAWASSYYLLATLARQGLGADVVSGGELLRALAAGVR